MPFTLRPLATRSTSAKQRTHLGAVTSIQKAAHEIFERCIAQAVAYKTIKRYVAPPCGGRGPALLTALVTVAAMLLGQQSRKEQREKQSWSERLVSHPLIAWVLENISVMGVATMACLAVPAPRYGSYISAFRAVYLALTVEVWGTVALQSLLVRRVYKHVPYFNRSEPPSESLTDYIKEYKLCNLPVDLVTAASVGIIFVSLRKREFEKVALSLAFSPIGFLKRMAVTRICVDIFFYAGHRALHHRALYWLHKRHHEHTKPTLLTNYHFAPIDLWIEGVLPSLVAMLTLEALGLPMTRLESNIMSTYFVWHEVGSHCGKPVPTVTYFPPLAPLYQLLLGPVDRGNILHHDLHHQLFDCNYGITIWPDLLMGTRACERGRHHSGTMRSDTASKGTLHAVF